MNEFLSKALTPVILTYVISGMRALGLSQTVKQIVEPLRNVRLTISTVVASYIILPLLAASIARLFGLDPALSYGLVLISMCAGAEIGPVLTAASNANVRLSGAILVMSFTGVLLAFERQVLQFADRELRTVAAPAGAAPRPLGDLLGAAAAGTGVRPTSRLRGGGSVRSRQPASERPVRSFTPGTPRSATACPGACTSRSTRDGRGPRVCWARRRPPPPPVRAVRCRPDPA